MWCKSCLGVVIFVLILNQFQVDAQIGRRCTTPNGEYASCVSIYSCTHLLDAVQTRDANQLRFLQKSQCPGFSNGVVVCCGRESNYVSTGNQGTNGRVLFNNGNSDSPNRNFRKNPNIPDRDTCGHDFSERIFGGEATAINEFPWMALLQYANNSGYRRWACAGTLINNRYILTAAHCVTGDILSKVGRLVNVRLGDYDTEKAVDCQGGLCNNPIDVGVEDAFAHAGYDNNNQHRYNDIALVRMSREVRFTPFIQPLCLPKVNEAAAVGDRMSVAGWGKTEYASRSAVKMKVEIPMAQRAQCTRAFASAGINLKSSQVCAGGQRGKDSCTGDSGGPLMTTAKDDPSTWYQEGIVSFGARCGTEGWPAIYTKVEYFLDWIHKNVQS